jgi:hypothetical protein
MLAKSRFRVWVVSSQEPQGPATTRQSSCAFLVNLCTFEAPNVAETNRREDHLVPKISRIDYRRLDGAMILRGPAVSPSIRARIPHSAQFTYKLLSKICIKFTFRWPAPWLNATGPPLTRLQTPERLFH